METMMREELTKVVKNHKNSAARYDGIIYIMHTRSPDGCVVPLYIGKAETVGKASGKLSVNVSGKREKSKFGRWGDSHAYHIGDLSSAVLPGHEIPVRGLKYQLWAEALFEGVNIENPRLFQQVFLWVKAWHKDNIGPWQEFGPTPLSFLEYLLIGLASTLFPENLNQEGHNRDT
jgi:hypothetical protein